MAKNTLVRLCAGPGLHMGDVARFSYNIPDGIINIRLRHRRLYNNYLRFVVPPQHLTNYVIRVIESDVS